MDHKINRIAYTGNMDKDSDVRYIGKGNNAGDGLDARNIQAVDAQGNVQGSIPPTLGNEFAFDLGQVSQQNKRYRITFDGDVTKQHELKFFSTQRDALMVVGTGTDGAVTFNGTQANFISQFNAAVAGSGVSVLVLTPTATTVEIELQGYNMYQWYLDSVGVDDVNFVTIREAIPVDLAGPLKDIGSYDLLGDLFIFSTTQDNEPSQIAPQVTAIGPISGGAYVGPLTTITFSAAHGLVQGQWIRIINSEASWLNGLFVVQQVLSATQIGIPTVLAWGGSRPLISSFTEEVLINPTGIGEIGVAQKNENTDIWTYTRLLRSIELNFVSKWQVDCDAEKDNRRTSIYFDDDYNSFRKFYYETDYTQDGALNYVLSANMYRYDSIQSQMYGFAKKPRVVINYDSQLPSGGQLPAGNIRYFVVLKDLFLNDTNPSSLSQPVITYSDAPNSLAVGDESGAITPKVNVLRLSNIDNLTYNKIALGYYMKVAGATVAFLNEFIPIVGDEMIINHTGNEPKTTFDVGALSLGSEDDYKYAKNIRIIDGRVVRSNLRKEEYNDFSAWFRTFKHRICVDPISETRPLSGQPPNEYQDPFNGFYKMGYMYNETYRMAGRAYLKDGSLTDWFWIDDIRVDPFLTNQANPSDNRRDQTGPNISTSFDLTESISPSPDFYSNKRVLVPYIDLFGAVFSYKINNKPVHEVVESIEIGRCEVIPEVIYTGAAIMSVKIVTGGPLDGYKRGFCLTVGEGAGANMIPVGIGVRAEDEDGTTSTYHEYMWAYGCPTGFLMYQTNPNTYVVTGATPPINNYPAIQYPSTNSTPFHPRWPEDDNGGADPFPPLQDSLVSERRILSIYAPDLLMTGAASSGFSIIDFGECLLDPLRFYNRWSILQSGSHFTDMYAKFHSQGFGTTYNEHLIDKLEHVAEGERGVLFGSSGFRKCYDYFIKFVRTQEIRGMKALWKIKTGPVVYVENAGLGLVSQGKNPDFGVHYVQIFSKKDGKYGEIDYSEYYTANAYLTVEAVNVEVRKGDLTVFGGDVFTQMSNIKTKWPDVTLSPAGTDPETWDISMGGLMSDSASWMDGSLGIAPTSANGPGFGSAISFYSQNRINSQMRYDNDDQFIMLSDTIDQTQWVFDYRYIDRDTYSFDYTPSNFGLTQVSGDFLSSVFRFDFPQRIHWSERKIYGELIDQFSIFLTLNIKDLDLKYGEIHHHEIVNGELLTLQNRKWMKQLFNARGELQTVEGDLGVLIGDGSVLSRDGQTLSLYGTQHKWSCHLTKSEGGKDIIVWYNAENGLFMRFGADGTLVISNRNNFRSYANKAAKWLRSKDTPAYDQGIRCVWDDRSKEVIWTFTGWREVNQAWTNGAFVEVGEVVTNTNAPFDTYEQLPRFFRCILVHTASPATEAGVGTDWETYWVAISYEDFDYYSVFTVAFNEATNGFKTFYGHIPKTYLKWQDTFLSSHPINRNLIFEHRRGLPTTWYGVDSFITGTIAPKVEDAYVEMVVNDVPEQTTRGIAVRYLSDNIPDRVDYRTKRHHTWDEAAQFRQDGDQWIAPIRKDATVTGTPVQGGDILTGEYLRVKFTIFGGTYNLLHSIVVKYLDKARRINR